MEGAQLRGELHGCGDSPVLGRLAGKAELGFVQIQRSVKGVR